MPFGSFSIMLTRTQAQNQPVVLTRALSPSLGWPVDLSATWTEDYLCDRVGGARVRVRARSHP